MSATLDHAGDHVGPASKNRLASYAQAGRSAVRRKWPAWLIVTIDVTAVLFALGLVHAINGMMFKTPAPTEVAAADQIAPAPLSNVPWANFARIPPAALMAQLENEAREAVAAVPTEQILFAQPAGLQTRFTTAAAPLQVLAFVNPTETPFAADGPGGGPRREEASSGDGGTSGGVVPPVAQPNPDPDTGTPPPLALTEPEPSLVVHVPLPEATAEVVEEVVAPPVETLVSVVDSVTGPPMDLRQQLGIDADVSIGSSDRGGGGSGTSDGSASDASGGGTAVSVAVSATDSDGGGGASGDGNPSGNSVTQTVSQVTSATTDTLRSTVSSTVGSVGRLLR